MGEGMADGLALSCVQVTNLSDRFHHPTDARWGRTLTDFTLIIVLTLVGFLALAAILLVPVYRFLRREEEASRKWSAREIARRRKLDPPGTNGRNANKTTSE